MADVWNHRDEEHRRALLAMIAPLVAASRPREFGTPQLAHDQARAFLMTLKDVPRDVLEEAIEALMLKGVTWMPRPGDLRAACAVVIETRRKVAARQAQALADDCTICDDEQWETVVVDGVERVRKCRCHTRGVELMAAVGEPLALPPAREQEEGAA